MKEAASSKRELVQTVFKESDAKKYNVNFYNLDSCAFISLCN